MHLSMSTIDSPEFINLQPLEISPFMSECEIKVLYLGENRNHSYITKEVATEMSKTLRGAPIVGYYSEEKQDFGDHGEQLIIDGDGVKFNCLTKPYGFVSPTAKVWFQKFNDVDEFGNEIEREYLMTTGYLWTEQFEEAKLAIEEGRPHSMELDEKTLEGHWAENNNTGIEFFIINDAIFSKLCILGDDVEPCFEGSSVKAPDVSKNFSLNEDFTNSLHTMMQQLKFALEGGQTMTTVDNNVQNETVEESVQTESQNFTQEAPEVTETPAAESDFEKKEDEEEKEEPKEDKNEATEEEEKKKTPTNNTCKDDEEEKEKKYTLKEVEAIKAEAAEKYTALEEKYNELVEFKNQIDTEKKQEMIDSFYMLSDEDKKEVTENISNYSVEDIEAKLSVICVRKKINFDLDTTSEKEEAPVTTFSVDDAQEDVPAWVKAVMKNRK